VVNVNVTDPLVIDGVYIALSELTLENVPLGALQVALVALPPIDAERLTVLPAQIVRGDPALAVAFPTVTIIVETAAGHVPGGSLVVNLRVTEPLLIDGV
jgi:hypothetical protein